MEKNGWYSCGEKPRHIHIRYFCIKDVLARANIDVVYCPTERMIADFFTKPLQGSLFRKLRDIRMGLAPFPMKERVGDRGIITTGNGASVIQSYADLVCAKKVTLQGKGRVLASEPIK